MNEDGSPYQGFVLRRQGNSNNVELKANYTNSLKMQTKAWNKDTIKKIKILRISNETIYSVNDEPFEKMLDFSEVQTFNSSVVFGDSLKANKQSLNRKFKGTLGNISVKYVDNLKLSDFIKPYLVIQPEGETANFLGGSIKKNEIESIRLAPSKAGANSTKWNVATTKDNAIIAWYTDTDNNGLYEVAIGSDEGITIRANSNSSNLFSFIGSNENSNNSTHIYGIEYLDTSNVTNMHYMFYGCSSLTELNLSSFNTANVTNTSGMFQQCPKLTKLNLSSFNTANVANMGYMFFRCNSLSKLDLSNFNTANATNMAGMFYSCNSLTELNLSSFNTANVTQMGNMFYNCKSLENLDIRAMSFNTSTLTDYTGIFSNCGKAGECIAYVNEDYLDFVTANSNNRWLRIEPVTVN